MSFMNFVKQQGFSAVASIRALSFFAPVPVLAVPGVQLCPSMVNNVGADCHVEHERKQPLRTGTEFDVPAKPSTCCEDSLSSELLLRLKCMFPDSPPDTSFTSCLYMYNTINSMAVWSYDSTKERDLCTKFFTLEATEVCERLKAQGYWCDFIDPSSGLPHFSSCNAEPLTDCDEDFTQLSSDLELEDIGCCRALKHIDWGFEVFAGVIFSNAPIDVINDFTK